MCFHDRDLHRIWIRNNACCILLTSGYFHQSAVWDTTCIWALGQVNVLKISSEGSVACATMIMDSKSMIIEYGRINNVHVQWRHYDSAKNVMSALPSLLLKLWRRRGPNWNKNWKTTLTVCVTWWCSLNGRRKKNNSRYMNIYKLALAKIHFTF